MREQIFANGKRVVSCERPSFRQPVSRQNEERKDRDDERADGEKDVRSTERTRRIDEIRVRVARRLPVAGKA